MDDDHRSWEAGAAALTGSWDRSRHHGRGRLQTAREGARGRDSGERAGEREARVSTGRGLLHKVVTGDRRAAPRAGDERGPQVKR